MPVSQISPEAKAVIMQEIAEAINEGLGTADLRRKYAKVVPERTFKRWVSVIRSGEWTAPGSDPSEAVKQAKRVMIGRDLPAAPQPRFMTNADPSAIRKIDFLATMEEAMSDILRLRAGAMRPLTQQEIEAGKDTFGDGMVVVNHHNFDKSITRRFEAMRTAITIMQELWDLEWIADFMQGVIQVIVEEIGPMDPKVQTRIMERLTLLNARLQGTVHAKRQPKFSE